jgi:threonine dehydratase
MKQSVVDSIVHPNHSSIYEQAHAKIKPYIVGTPVIHDTTLSQKTGANIWYKCEQQQNTGSFKFRGAIHKLLALSEEQKKQGVITSSTGNHGLAVARAASLTNTSASIYLSHGISSMKQQKLADSGATIISYGNNPLMSELYARTQSELLGAPYISPYNDIDIIKGQGSIGVELREQLEQIDAIFIAVGGGGLISGIGDYIKSYSPETEIVACLPENAPTMKYCLDAGKIVEIQEKPTLSEGTAGGIEPNSVTFPLCQRVIDRCVLVSESDIRAAMKHVYRTQNYTIEGAAGVALAGFLKTQEYYKNKCVVVLLCGGNISKNILEEIVQ